MFRSLTLTQPWCGLVASGIKRIENRPRRMIKRTDFGVPFAIHASRVIDEPVYDRIEEIAPELALLPSFMMNGTSTAGIVAPEWYRLSRIKSAIIAVATIVRDVTVDEVATGAITSHDQRRWFFGPVGYVLSDIVALPRPVPARGYQGFWTLDPATERLVREQMKAAA